jgi:hypothetical protein
VNCERLFPVSRAREETGLFRDCPRERKKGKEAPVAAKCETSDDAKILRWEHAGVGNYLAGVIPAVALCLPIFGFASSSRAYADAPPAMMRYVPSTYWPYDAACGFEAAGLHAAGYRQPQSGYHRISRYEFALVTSAALRDLERRMEGPARPHLDGVTLNRLIRDLQKLGAEFRDELEQVGVPQTEMVARLARLAERCDAWTRLPGPLEGLRPRPTPSLKDRLRTSLKCERSLW